MISDFEHRQIGDGGCIMLERKVILRGSLTLDGEEREGPS
jgi:hypothetical protein